VVVTCSSAPTLKQRRRRCSHTRARSSRAYDGDGSGSGSDQSGCGGACRPDTDDEHLSPINPRAQK